MHARSCLMEMAGRAGLLMLSRAPLAFGRRSMSAQALEELARRAVLRHNFVDCGLLRAQRLEKVVQGRRIQILSFLADSPEFESSSQYVSILDTMLQMRCAVQAAVAMESMSEVINAHQA